MREFVGKSRSEWIQSCCRGQTTLFLHGWPLGKDGPVKAASETLTMGKDDRKTKWSLGLSHCSKLKPQRASKKPKAGHELKNRWTNGAPHFLIQPEARHIAGQLTKGLLNAAQEGKTGKLLRHMTVSDSGWRNSCAIPYSLKQMFAMLGGSSQLCLV